MSHTSQCFVLAFSCVIAGTFLGCGENCPHPREKSDPVADASNTGDKEATKNSSDARDLSLQEAIEWSTKPSTSLIQILANPDKYDGKRVCVKGFLRIEHEGNAIYLSESDDQHMMTSNAFWVCYDNNAMRMTQKELREKFDKKYVLLIATFNKEGYGHMGLFQGEFKDVVTVGVIPDRSELERKTNE